MFGQRILILAPHPDDEVVACGAAIGRAQAQGSKIFVLYLTHGCIAQAAMWPWARKNHEACVARRQRESGEAARFLALTSIGQATRPARYLWRELNDVYREIETAVAQNKIDQIWLPAYEGGNADHDALNAIGQLFREQIGVLEFAEYNFAGGVTHSQEFPHPNGTEQVVALTTAEMEKKRAALAIYRSERSNLGYVKTTHESWRPLAAYDYRHPPHDGVLWYARFQWVPFRHPRVDFTRPQEVSAAITAFLEAQAKKTGKALSR
jgi:LmbE family N-acetylglucosaminyl deacetylase